MRYFFSLLLMAATLVACVQKKVELPQAIPMPDIGVPPISPEIFAAGVISTGQQQRDLAISPDGKTICYTLGAPGAQFSAIVCLQAQADGSWSAPYIPPFSGRYQDLEPAFAPNGQYLYFASNRPVSGDSLHDFDLWRVGYSTAGWGQTEHLPIVNGPGNDFYPSIAANGNLYFTAQRDDAVGLEDIYVSEWKDGAFSPPTPLDTGVNTTGYEFNAFVAPDESYIIFSGYQRPEGYGSGDLYVSYRQANGTWGKAENLGPSINSSKLDFCPFVYGNALFYTQAAQGLAAPMDSAITLEKMQQLLAQPDNGNNSIYWVKWEPATP